MIHLIIAFLIAFLYSICSPFFHTKGGMALHQTREKNTNMCQFDAFLHTFVCNKELNKIACKNLNKRIRIKKEPFWRPILSILCHSNDEVRQKICSIKECYFPDEILGKELRDILDEMVESGYPKGNSDLYVDSTVLFSMFNVDYDIKNISGYNKIYKEIVSKIDDEDPRVNLGSDYMLMETLSETDKDMAIQLCNLINIDFEATFIIYRGGDIGHVMTIVKIADGSYVLYDDSNETQFNGLRGLVIMNVILDLIKRKVDYIVLQTITKNCISINNISNKKLVIEWFDKHFKETDDPMPLYDSFKKNINFYADDEDFV